MLQDMMIWGGGSHSTVIADKKQKASSTQRDSQAVPHPSTNRALHRLTAEFGRDPVCSMRYGRWRNIKSSGPYVSGRTLFFAEHAKIIGNKARLI